MPKSLLGPIARKTVRSAFNYLGLDVRRLHNSPLHTMLGLRGKRVGTVIDIGANVGQFARQAAEMFPAARIYSFEPLPDAFVALESWASSALGDRIVCFNLALGDSRGDLDMFRHSEHTSSSSLLAATEASKTMYPFVSSQERVKVRIETLDDLLARGDIVLDPLTLVKLDVQGYEDRVIRGGRKLLSRADAVILEVCIDPLYEHQARFHELVAELHGLGLSYAGNLDQHYAADGRCVFLDAMFVGIDQVRSTGVNTTAGGDRSAPMARDA